MALTAVRAFGLDYLDLATRLLQQARLEHPTKGVWEAADLQWWWRAPRATDPLGQDFWLEDGDPVGAVVFTEWRRSWACDVLVMPSRAADLVPVLWEHAMARAAELSPPMLDVMLDDGDGLLTELVLAAGFVAGDEKGGSALLAAADRPPVPPLAAGYRLADRAVAGDRPHHMIPRSHPDVAERLSQTSLYRPELDLLVETAAGEMAAFGLFWHDPVTGVGFVEPMRTEQAHQGRGLAGHVLAAGLERLARLGATRLKVNYEVGNTAAERLYFGAGFEPAASQSMFSRSFG